MASAFGWTHISREALRRAEEQMKDSAARVRDEIGVLQLHQRYADRFFPGTSVLHTRLRYALFVPWMYEALRTRTVSGEIRRLIQSAERDLVLRLLPQRGVIGGESSNYISSRPPSEVYWNALATWKILTTVDGIRAHPRVRVHALLSQRQRKTDDDGMPLHEGRVFQPFIELPRAPTDWHSKNKVSFALQDHEHEFFATLWRLLQCDREDPRPTVLARLTDYFVPDIQRTRTCWDESVQAVAGTERATLRRARHVAALAGIARAVYAALVEQARDEDGLNTPRRHRDHLDWMVDKYGAAARKFSLGAVEGDIGPLTNDVRPVLQETHSWLVNDREDIGPLRAVYEETERLRKSGRARLQDTGFGKERRREWDSTEYPKAEPLHYRWQQVRTLVADLHGQTNDQRTETLA